MLAYIYWEYTVMAEPEKTALRKKSAQTITKHYQKIAPDLVTTPIKLISMKRKVRLTISARPSTRFIAYSSKKKRVSSSLATQPLASA
jgi:hypothetical protein